MGGMSHKWRKQKHFTKNKTWLNCIPGTGLVLVLVLGRGAPIVATGCDAVDDCAISANRAALRLASETRA